MAERILISIIYTTLKTFAHPMKIIRWFREKEGEKKGVVRKRGRER